MTREPLHRMTGTTGDGMNCFAETLLILPLAVVLAGCGPQPAPPAAPPPAPTKPASPTISPVETRARLAAAVQMAPDDPQASLKLALFDWETHETAQAEQELIALNMKFPRFADGPFQLGSLYLNLGQNEAAIPPLQQAVRLAPKRDDVLLIAGLACFRMSRYAEAQQYVNQAIRLNPDAPAPYLLQARLYSNHGTAQQSLTALHDYLKRSKEPEPGYYLMGRLYYRQADQTQAEHWLKQAVALKEDNPDTWAVLGHVYCELDNGKRLEEGISCYEKALALRQKDWETQAALGRALMQKQQWEGAVLHLRAALQEAPDPGPLLYTLGQALQQGGHAEEGRQMLAEYKDYQDFTRGETRLKRAIKEAPQDRSRRYELARWCLDYRQYSAAETVLNETARKFGPDDTLRQLQARIAAGRKRD